jgi:hypothetical protein
MLPSQFLALERREKAAVIAMIDIKLKDDKEKEQELNRKSKKK